MTKLGEREEKTEEGNAVSDGFYKKWNTRTDFTTVFQKSMGSLIQLASCLTTKGKTNKEKMNLCMLGKWCI